jgi:hypothetical protein
VNRPGAIELVDSGPWRDDGLARFMAENVGRKVRVTFRAPGGAVVCRKKARIVGPDGTPRKKKKRG